MQNLTAITRGIDSVFTSDSYVASGVNTVVGINKNNHTKLVNLSIITKSSYSLTDGTNILPFKLDPSLKYFIPSAHYENFQWLLLDGLFRLTPVGLIYVGGTNLVDKKFNISVSYFTD